jgi:hypothetical protein
VDVDAVDLHEAAIRASKLSRRHGILEGRHRDEERDHEESDNGYDYDNQKNPK